MMFERVLVANRGEIAVRILRTLHRLGIQSVAVYSEADAQALHVRQADQAVAIGPALARLSYLSIERIIEAAVSSSAQAVHPGYGFLSENPDLASACDAAGLVFIGPSAAAISAMGDKIRAKALVAAHGVPVVPGVDGRGLDQASLVEAGRAMGTPLLIKPSAGGGGKGMRLVEDLATLGDDLQAAQRTARNAFGDDTLLLERYIERPRHIEIQVAADTHGHVVHLGERECSLQRRHQKIVEEAPSPLLTSELRQAMGAQAIACVTSCGYTNIGTVEFIMPGDGSGQFYFMEMNTRLQVEHPVTELVYGVDLVETQLRIAAGQPLPWTQSDLMPNGHAIEARVYAEDPSNGFLPTGGRVLALREPCDVRVDSSLYAGCEVGSDYDPMLAKVIAHAPDRPEALRRLDDALAEYAIVGVTTNLGHLRAVLADPDVVAGDLDTTLIERHHADMSTPPPPTSAYAIAALRRLSPDPTDPSPWSTLVGWRQGEPAQSTVRLRANDQTVTVGLRAAGDDAWTVRVDDQPATVVTLRSSPQPRPGELVIETGTHGQRDRYLVVDDGDTTWLASGGTTWPIRSAPLQRADQAAASWSGPIVSPMPGTLLALKVVVGETVQAGQALAVVEAMKMEHTVTAPAAGVVSLIHCIVNDQLRLGQHILTLTPLEGAPP